MIEEHSTSDLCRERRSEFGGEEAMRGDWGVVECARTVQLLKSTPNKRLKGFIMNMFVNWEVNGCERKLWTVVLFDEIPSHQARGNSAPKFSRYWHHLEALNNSSCI